VWQGFSQTCRDTLKPKLKMKAQHASLVTGSLPYHVKAFGHTVWRDIKSYANMPALMGLAYDAGTKVIQADLEDTKWGLLRAATEIVALPLQKGAKAVTRNHQRIAAIHQHRQNVHDAAKNQTSSLTVSYKKQQPYENRV
jgi:hypothetical protein